MKPLVEIIVNKNWEVEPFLAAMNGKTKPESFPAPYILHSPMDPKNRMASCRAEYHLEYMNVIVRCIQDLMDAEKHASNSEEKYRVLPGYIKADNPSLIISVSTAESTPIIEKEIGSQNGSVFIGGTFYMFDAHDYDQGSPSHLSVIELQKNSVPDAIYNLVGKTFRETVLGKFIPAVNAPSRKMTCVADPDFVSIGVVNVINYEVYTKADTAAYNEFMRKYGTRYTAATIETTHGIVRMSAGNVPTLFVSPITDRYNHFKEDVDPEGKQNSIAANNAGVAIAELLVRLNNLYDSRTCPC